MHFFQNYVNYALRAEFYDFASAHNSGSPECDLSFMSQKSLWNSKCTGFKRNDAIELESCKQI